MPRTCRNRIAEPRGRCSAMAPETRRTDATCDSCHAATMRVLRASLLLCGVVAAVLVGATASRAEVEGRSGTIAFLRGGLFVDQGRRQRPSAAHAQRRRCRLLSMVARWEPHRLPGQSGRPWACAPRRYGASAFGCSFAVEESVVSELVSGREGDRGARPRSRHTTSAQELGCGPQDHRHPDRRRRSRGDSRPAMSVSSHGLHEAIRSRI